MFRVQEYLKRLNLTEVLSPTSEFLHQLHFAHLLNIPYENIDIINRISFNLDENYLFNKIITNHRGGYCYELTILFKRLLVELGYKVDLHSARIINQYDKIPGPEFDHSILLVTLETKWLADIGNSLWFVKPIKLDGSKPYTQNYQTFKIKRTPDNIYTLMEKKSPEDNFQPQYTFTEIPRQGSDFNEMCQYKWTSPESKFTKEYICSRITESGRIYLKSSGLIIYEKGIKTEINIYSTDEFKFYLRKYFGRELSDSVNNYKLQT